MPLQICDGWTFFRLPNKTVHKCVLVGGSTSLCQNIFESRVENPLAISGYSCLSQNTDIQCWGTTKFSGRNFCPDYGIDWRAGPAWTLENATIHGSGTVGISSVDNPQSVSCVVYRFIKGRWRAIRRNKDKSN